MFEFPDYHFVQFAKAPLPGRVKTRLSGVLSEAQCVSLHKALTRHTAATLLASRLCPTELWAGSEPEHPFFKQLSENFGLPLYRQSEGDLGQRLFAATTAVLSRAKGVILVGSDCPQFDTAYLRRAVTALASGAEAVIGPARDGGYVLLGLSRPSPAPFTDIDWGTEKVLRQTCERLDTLAWQYAKLPALADIDRPEDLRYLHEAIRLEHGGFNS